jgi:hypothetical protein
LPPLCLDEVLDKVHEKCEKSYRRQAEGPIAVTVVGEPKYDIRYDNRWTDPSIEVVVVLHVEVSFEQTAEAKAAAQRRKEKSEKALQARISRAEKELARLKRGQ